VTELKGQPLLAAGFFLDAADPNWRPSPRDGILSSVYPDANGIVQTTVPTTPGMNGGPVLLKDTGALLGIVAGAVFDHGTRKLQYLGILAAQEIATELGLQQATQCPPQAPETPGARTTAAASNPALLNSASGGSVAVGRDVSNSVVTILNLSLSFSKAAAIALAVALVLALLALLRWKRGGSSITAANGSIGAGTVQNSTITITNAPRIDETRDPPRRQ
jgi:lysylphosphatidylglycerol synthetase-like protein (DUF2156 family)